MCRTIRLFLLPLMLLWLPSSVESSLAEIIYVDEAATGDNTGQTWADAYVQLSSALNRANDGDQVYTAEGVYTPGTLPTASFALETGVEVYGGFPTGGSSFAQRNPDVFVTTLSGDLGGGTRSTTIVSASGVDQTAILDGFTITGAGEHAVAISGGASPTLSNLRIVSNQSTGYGAGLCMENTGGSSPLVKDCTFARNYATFGAGAYLVRSSTSAPTGVPTFENCRFIANIATTSGGAVRSNDMKPVFKGCLFEDNQATTQGGAIYTHGHSYTTLELRNCTIPAATGLPKAEASIASMER